MKEDGSCSRIVPVARVPILIVSLTSFTRPAVAIPLELMEPSTKKKNSASPLVSVRSRHPRWSGPTTYKLPVVLIVGGTLPAPLLYPISSANPVIFPVPSAVRLPTTLRPPHCGSKGCSRNAYCPFNIASRPEPALQIRRPPAVVRTCVLLPDLVGSSTEVATTLTTGRTGEVVGAVYVAGAPLRVLVGLIVPQAGEQATPFCCTLHVTPWLVPSFATVAVPCRGMLNGTVAGC